VGWNIRQENPSRCRHGASPRCARAKRYRVLTPIRSTPAGDEPDGRQEAGVTHHCGILFSHLIHKVNAAVTFSASSVLSVLKQLRIRSFNTEAAEHRAPDRNRSSGSVCLAFRSTSHAKPPRRKDRQPRIRAGRSTGLAARQTLPLCGSAPLRETISGTLSILSHAKPPRRKGLNPSLASLLLALLPF